MFSGKGVRKTLALLTTIATVASVSGCSPRIEESRYASFQEKGLEFVINKDFMEDEKDVLMLSTNDFDSNNAYSTSARAELFKDLIESHWNAKITLYPEDFYSKGERLLL